MNKLIAAIAIVLSASLSLSACASNLVPLSNEGADNSQISVELKPYYEQKVAWSECGDGFDCADVVAPLDWKDTSRGDISLAVVRHKATGKQTLGSLFINPGGPGASGVSMVLDSLDYAVSTQIQKAYDVIGFDPRGVGESTAVTCFTDSSQMDKFLYGVNPYPRNSVEWLQERQTGSAEFADACAQSSGELLDFVGTDSAARDLDLLRAVVNDAVLNYLGYSYGTLLGATYAELFPTHVGRMVLDGALDPSSSGSTVLISQAVGFENSLRAYLVWCFAQDECLFDVEGAGPVDVATDSPEVNQAMQDISGILAELDVLPVAGDDGRVVNADTMVTAIIAPLYSPEAWEYLSEVFVDTINGDGTTALASADWYNGREVDGTYADNSTEAFLAVNCLDYPVNADSAAWKADAAELSRQAPVIGPYLAYGDFICLAWPSAPVREPAKIHATGSPDILVIGTTGDPATPYQWAQNLAAQLENGHLVTYNGEGHTAYNKSNVCVNRTVDDFLLQGKVPASDPKC